MKVVLHSGVTLHTVTHIIETNVSNIYIKNPSSAILFWHYSYT